MNLEIVYKSKELANNEGLEFTCSDFQQSVEIRRSKDGVESQSFQTTAGKRERFLLQGSEAVLTSAAASWAYIR